MATKELECPPWPLLNCLSLTMCVANGVYFYLGHIFLILSISAC